MLSRRHFLLGTLPLPALSAASPENWPEFRGSGVPGVSGDDPKLPDSWSATENIAWKTDVPGYGWSSPVVWGDRVFVTSVIPVGDIEAPRKGLYGNGNRLEPPTAAHRWMVYCIDFRNGKMLWEKQVHEGVPRAPKHLKNTYASETPVTDGERVYAHFGYLGTYCFDMDGKLLWSKAWDPHPIRNGWGTAASPVLHEGRLYIVNDNDASSFLVALDRATGHEIWRVARDEGSNWAPPYIWKNQQRTEIITSGTGRVRSYDLDGKLLWEIGGMSSITIPQPLASHGLLYVTSGYVGDEKRPVFAIRPGASGDLTLQPGQASSEFIAWSHPQAGPYNPSPLVFGDYYYTLFDRGFFTCHDALTGKEIYDKQRFEVGAGAFTASPWAYNGKIFCLSEDGDTFVVKAGPSFEILHKNSLGEMCMATPAIARGSLIVRTQERLLKIARNF
jgi:outer membrane protein assembly factor BamB